MDRSLTLLSKVNQHISLNIILFLKNNQSEKVLRGLFLISDSNQNHNLIYESKIIQPHANIGRKMSLKINAPSLESACIFLSGSAI